MFSKYQMNEDSQESTLYSLVQVSIQQYAYVRIYIQAHTHTWSNINTVFAGDSPSNEKTSPHCSKYEGRIVDPVTFHAGLAEKKESTTLEWAREREKDEVEYTHVSCYGEIRMLCKDSTPHCTVKCHGVWWGGCRKKLGRIMKSQGKELNLCQSLSTRFWFVW